MSWTVGQLITATRLNLMTTPGWTDYGSDTTTLTAVTTNPTKGNSTYTARYRYPTSSDLCHFEIAITIGSTFSAGSGSYRFLLPFASPTSALITCIGAINESGVALRVGTSQYVDTTHFQIFYDGAGGVVGNGGLSTSWTTGDSVTLAGHYRVAV